MSELIDRMTLIKALEKDKHSICSHVYGCINPCDADDLEFELEYLIYNQPTVEAKPVVHCRDCCFLEVCKTSQWLGLDGYCSRGEKHD